jgi:hypothetical protein
MYKVLSEASIIGIITLILGKILLELIIKNNDKDKDKKHPHGIYLAFFSTGFLLHFVIEYLGINCWYCDKKCAVRLRNMV